MAEERQPSTSNVNYIFHKKGNLLERSVGRLGATWLNAQIGTLPSSFKDVTQADADILMKMFENVEWKGKIDVNFNHSPLFNQLKRLFSTDRRSNLFVRSTFGVLSTVVNTVGANLARRDYYNQFTESAVIFHKNKFVGAQQLGRAEFYDQTTFSTLNSILYGSVPVLRTQREFNASRIVMEHLTTDEERQKARKVLEPLFGIQVGQDLGAVSNYLLKRIPGLPGVDVLPFSVPLGLIPKKLLITTPLIPAIGALIGHIHARTAQRNIFFDREKKVVEPVVLQPAVVPAVVPAAA